MPGASRLAGLDRATTRRALLLGTAGAAVLVATPGAAEEPRLAMRTPVRVGTWAASSTAVVAGRARVLAGETIRQVVHTSVGGDRPRVRLTNEFGTRPVRIGAARIGLRAGAGASNIVVPGSDRPLTFAGQTQAVIPAGGTLLSDSAELVVPAGADLAISLFLPEATPLETITPRAFQTNLVSPGNATAVANPTGKPTSRYAFLAGVSVRAVPTASSIITLGDSITNGANALDDANHRWPDLLAERLRTGEPGRAPLDRGVLNLGISGNRLLVGPVGVSGRAGANAMSGESGLRRFTRDVLAQPGAGYLVVLLGVNDLGHASPTTAENLIAGHRELITRGRAAGLRVIGGTLLPFGGARRGYDTLVNRSKRETFNTWIRTGGEYDAFIDFDRAIRDPIDPHRMLPAYDCGDHLHPNDAGMAAMAAAVPLDLFV